MNDCPQLDSSMSYDSWKDTWITKCNWPEINEAGNTMITAEWAGSNKQECKLSESCEDGRTCVKFTLLSGGVEDEPENQEFPFVVGRSWLKCQYDEEV